MFNEKTSPFLHKHYPEFQYIFWPDLASVHYSNAVVAWMDENLYYVAKEINCQMIHKLGQLRFV